MRCSKTSLLVQPWPLRRSYGERLRKCGTQQVNKDLAAGLSPELRAGLEPLLTEVALPSTTGGSNRSPPKYTPNLLSKLQCHLF